jgi:transcriptional regulator with XRE-family HTH domain
MRADVKRKLAERRLSQADVARRIGCTKAAICRVLSGSLGSPFLQHEIAQVLGEDPAALWGEDWWLNRRRAGHGVALANQSRRDAS